MKEEKPKRIVSKFYDDLPAYAVTRKEKSSRAYHLLSALKSKKDMVILKEIMGPPKGL